MGARSERRRLVNAGVIAGSAVMFAAAWIGIVRSDTRAEAVVQSTAVVATESLPSAAAGPIGPAAASTSLQSTPAPTRRVVVARQSRAS